MRIAIDLTSLSFHITGIERYSQCIAKRMVEQSNDKFILVFRNEIDKELIETSLRDNVETVVIRDNGNKIVFFQWTLFRTFQKIKAEKYLFFAFPSPWLFRKQGIYNAIHDMGAWDCPQAMTLASRTYFKLSYRLVTPISDGLITVSDFSKYRINKILGYDENKILVAYSAVSDALSKENKSSFEDVKKKYSIPDKYIMTLSTLEPRKNTKLLLNAFYAISDKVEYDLVLIGRKGWKVDELLALYGSVDRIHITGYVDDEDASVIYQNAKCFVFPSIYEGFGLPPVESLTLGCPVIASNAASIPEVLQDRAIYFKSGDIEELKDSLLEINEEMPKSLNAFQKANYDFGVSAKKILSFIR